MTNAETFWKHHDGESRDLLDALRDLEENGIQFGYVTVHKGKLLETDVEAVEFEDGSVLLLHGPDLGGGEFPLPASEAKRAGIDEVGDFQPIEGVQLGGAWDDEARRRQERVQNEFRDLGRKHGAHAADEIADVWANELADWDWPAFKGACQQFVRGLYFAPPVRPKFTRAPKPHRAEKVYWLGVKHAARNAWAKLH